MQTERFSANPDIVLRIEDDGAFLFDPDSGRICFVNEIGIAIWRYCGQPVTLSEIIHRIESDYTDVPAQAAMADCRGFLAELEKLGFLTYAVE